MAVFLHNPSSRAHLEDLKDRLFGVRRALRPLDARQREDEALIDWLVEVVEAMDEGAITPKDAIEVFACHPVPGFSFGRWLVEMVDEDVYLEALFNEAA